MPYIEHKNEAHKDGDTVPVTRICHVTDGGQWRDNHHRTIRYYASHSEDGHEDDDPYGKANALAAAAAGPRTGYNGGSSGLKRGLNTGAGAWIKSVTQNLCAGYHEWAARVTLDYGLIAFHVTDLKKEMAKRAVDGGSSESARGFYDVSAEDIKPFAVFDHHPAPQMQTTLLVDKWGLDPPRAIISIIGSAQEEVELPPNLELSVFKSLLTMAEAGTTWFLTDGWSSGAGKFLGKALHGNSANAPIIGIGSWDDLDKSENQWGSADEDVENICDGGMMLLETDEQQGLQGDHMWLDHQHTHHIISRGTRREVDANRRRLEEHLTSNKHLVSFGLFCTESPITCVALVFGGGLDEIPELMVRVDYNANDRKVTYNKTQVVVVGGSGGLADCIAYAAHLEQGHDLDGEPYTAEDLEFMISDRFGTAANVGESGKRLTEDIMKIVTTGLRKRTLRIFSPESSDTREGTLSRITLDALLLGDEKWTANVQETTGIKSGSIEEAALLTKRRKLRRCYRAELTATWKEPELAAVEINEGQFLQNIEGRYATIKDKIEDIYPGGVTFAQQTMLKYCLQQEGNPTLAIMCISNMRAADVTHFLNWSTESFCPFQTERRKDANMTPGGLDLFDDSDFDVPWYIVGNLSWMESTGKELLELEKTGKHGIHHKPQKGHGKVTRRASLHTHKTYAEESPEAEAEQLLSYYLKLFVSAGMVLSITEHPPAFGEPSLSNPEIVEGVVKLIAKTIHHSWLINTEIMLHAVEKEDINVPYHMLSDEARKRCDDRGRIVWGIMEEAGLVLWDGDNLEDMYVNSMAKSEDSGEKSRHVSMFLQRGCCTREDVHDLLRDLVGNAEWPYISQRQMQTSRQIGDIDVSNEKTRVQSPYYHLMIWAIITNRKRLAKYFWFLTDEVSLQTGLVASQISRELATRWELDPEIHNGYIKLSNFFENETAAVLAEAHKNDANLTVEILKSGSAESGYIPIWGLAFNLKAKKITVSPGYSAVMDSEWNGHIHHHGTAKLIFGALSIFYPIYLCFWNPFPREYAEESTPFGWTVWLLELLCVRMDHEAMIPQYKIKKPGYLKLCYARIKHFFAAPITTFFIELIAYMLLVLLFTYSSLVPAQSWAKSWSLLTGTWRSNPHDDRSNDSLDALLQMVVLFWLFTMLMDEIYSLTLGDGYTKWSKNVWNWIDTVMFSFCFIGFGLRLGEDPQFYDASKGFNGIGAFLLWGRAMRYFAFSEQLGPKVNMLGKMLTKDILIFLQLQLLVLIGYGVCAIIVSSPFVDVRETTFWDVLYRPMFQIYGETFLDSIAEEGRCVGVDLHSCAGYAKLSAALLWLYLLVTNILLVNLLIAMMSATYEEVEEESAEVWSLQYTALLEEVRFKFPLPAPLSFFNVVYRVISKCYGKIKTAICLKLFSKNNQIGDNHNITADERADMGIAEGYTRRRIDEHQASSLNDNRSCAPWDHDVYGRFLEYTVEGYKEEKEAADKLSQLKDMVGIQSKIISELKKSIGKMRPSLSYNKKR